MVDIPITMACGNYDRTRPIMDGRVRVEGCAVTYLPLYPEEIIFRAFRYHEFDVCELSFSSYIRTVANGTSAYAAIPAFVSRIFRHSGIYIRRDAGIRVPQDLRGKRIGLPEYQITAVVWMRGMMQHEYGVRPQEIRWRSGGQEEPGRGERTPLAPIPGLDLKPIEDGKTLVGMLRDGELAVHRPRAVLVPARRAAHRPAVSRHPRRRDRLLQEDRAVPDHASHRHPQHAARAISVARDQRLQGVLRGQGARHDGPLRRQRADGDAPVPRSRDAGDHGGHGRRLLALRGP
jgi:hypothetical protein